MSVSSPPKNPTRVYNVVPVLDAGEDRIATRVFSRWERDNSAEAEKREASTFQEGKQPIIEAPRAFPEIGESFMGFKLVSLLGTGGFAKVYLAQQENLADRAVALKVTALPNREPQKLARLRHPNIMPIHSVHYSMPFQAVCMPYLGTATLHDVTKSVFKNKGTPTSGSIFETEKAQRTMLVSNHPDAATYLDSPVDNPNQSFQLRHELLRLGYVEAILTILSRVCDGLEHAHQMGLIHRDLKPANILLCSDGQPMLLDFNLAVDFSETEPVETGGTIPYMSPEQLRILSEMRDRELSPSSDLYSLGIIAYELFAGQSPFPVHFKNGSHEQFNLKAMEASRRMPPPLARNFNREVPPSVDAILRKMLAYEERDRYQNARDLKEDLDRQLANRPLRHAAEPSVTIRYAKWRKRHPKALYVIAASLALLASGSYGLAHERARFIDDKLKADETFGFTMATLDRARLDMADLERLDLRRRGAADVTEIANRYGVLDSQDWNRSREFQMLAPQRQKQLRERLGEALLRLASWHQEQSESDSIRTALELNQKAELCYIAGEMPETGWQQRKSLAEKLDLPKLAEAARLHLQMPEVDDPGNALLKALDYRRRYMHEDAIRQLKIYADRNPTRADGHLLLAESYLQLHQDDLALERLNLALANDPNNARALLHRAIVLDRRDQRGQAMQDINKALEIDTLQGWVYAIKAKLLHEKGRNDDALKALDAAERDGYSRLRTVAAKIDILKKSGRRSEAEDLAEWLDLIAPRTADEYVLRGYARSSYDKEGANEDFQAAAKLEPRRLDILNNLASSYSRLGDLTNAIATLKKCLEIAPDYKLAQNSLAVLLAREGQREQAHRLAKESIKNSLSKDFFYQAACVYSLTSESHPTDADLALKYLARAILLGYRDLDQMKNDKDLAAVRSKKEFQEIAGTTQILKIWGIDLAK